MCQVSQDERVAMPSIARLVLELPGASPVEALRNRVALLAGI